MTPTNYPHATRSNPLARSRPLSKPAGGSKMPHPQNCGPLSACLEYGGGMNAPEPGCGLNLRLVRHLGGPWIPETVRRPLDCRGQSLLSNASKSPGQPPHDRSAERRSCPARRELHYIALDLDGDVAAMLRSSLHTLTTRREDLTARRLVGPCAANISRAHLLTGASHVP